MVNLTNEEHQRLCEQAKRAEAAEARAAELEAQLIGAASVVVTLTTERDGLRAKLAEIKSILAGGRTVGGDVEQAYRDAEEIAEDGAESYKAMTP